jgi:hypothetical protein
MTLVSPEEDLLDIDESIAGRTPHSEFEFGDVVALGSTYFAKLALLGAGAILVGVVIRSTLLFVTPAPPNRLPRIDLSVKDPIFRLPLAARRLGPEGAKIDAATTRAPIPGVAVPNPPTNVRVQ